MAHAELLDVMPAELADICGEYMGGDRPHFWMKKLAVTNEIKGCNTGVLHLVFDETDVQINLVGDVAHTMLFATRCIRDGKDPKIHAKVCHLAKACELMDSLDMVVFALERMAVNRIVTINLLPSEGIGRALNKTLLTQANMRAYYKHKADALLAKIAADEARAAAGSVGHCCML